MIVFGLLFVLLWLIKTKLAPFSNINSNVVHTNETIACFEWLLPLHRRLRLNGNSWELKFFFQRCTEKFQNKALQKFSRWQIIIVEKKSASYVLECNGFYDVVFISIVCKHFLFSFWIWLLLIPMHARPLLSPSENREIHFILFIFYFNFCFVPCPPVFLRLRTPALVNK